jgi:hypothetical protein
MTYQINVYNGMWYVTKFSRTHRGAKNTLTRLLNKYGAHSLVRVNFGNDDGYTTVFFKDFYEEKHWC